MTLFGNKRIYLRLCWPPLCCPLPFVGGVGIISIAILVFIALVVIF